MTAQLPEKAQTWRDFCKHYGSCLIGSNGRCFTPEDPAYVADMERRDAEFTDWIDRVTRPGVTS